MPNKRYAKLIIVLIPVAFLAAYLSLQLSLQFVGRELPLWLRIYCLVYIATMAAIVVMGLVSSLWLKLPIKDMAFGFGKRWFRTNIAGIPISFGIFLFGGYVKHGDEMHHIGWRRCVVELSGCTLLLVFAAIIMGRPEASDVFVLWRHLVEGALSPFGQAQFLLMDLGRHLAGLDELSTLAVVSFGVAAINLLPLPLFSGGNAIMYFVDAALYPLTSRAQEQAFRAGFLVMLFGYGSWLIALLYLAYNSWARTSLGWLARSALM